MPAVRIPSVPAAWRDAARREGLSLLAWIRAACELAIARGSTR